MLWDMRFIFLCVKHLIFVWMCYWCHGLVKLWTFLNFNECMWPFKKKTQPWPAARTDSRLQHLLATSVEATAHSRAFINILLRACEKAKTRVGASLRGRGGAWIGSARRAQRTSFMGRQIAIFPLGIVACARWLGRDETCAPVGRPGAAPADPRVAHCQWRQPALAGVRGPATASAGVHRTAWNIRQIQRRCCHQNRRGILCRFYPHRTNSGRRAYFLIKNDRRE